MIMAAYNQLAAVELVLLVLVISSVLLWVMAYLHSKTED